MWVMDKETKDEIKEAVQEAFSAEGGTKRFIDVSRVPLICQAIVGISGDIKEINEKLDKNFVTKVEFTPVRMLVYGFVGLVLTVVILGLLALVLTNAHGPAIKV